MAGRKAKPLELILLQGNSHITKKEIAQRKEREINPKKDKIKCPSWLDPVAKKEWRRISLELQELNLLTNIDINALAIYCDAFSKYMKATEEINKFGLVIKHTNKSGATNIVTNPYVQIANKYADLINKYCVEFGLTPSARAKISIPKKEEKEKTPAEEMFGDI
jgi:P27 family predicted phage terminase small subunit